MTRLVVCLKCNWTSFAVTKVEAEAEVKRFNDYFYNLPEDRRMDLYNNKPASLERYVCLSCGGNEFKPGSTAPNGSTINSVIYEDKNESR